MTKVRTRKRGKTYSYAFEAGRKADGKRQVIEKGGFDTRDAAYDAGIKAYTDYKHGGIGVTSERMTLQEFSQVWLSYIKKEVSDGSFTTYKTYLDKHILPYLGEMTLQDIKPAHVEKLLLQLRDDKLSRRTLQAIRAIFSQVMKYAVFPAGLLDANPVTFIKVPKAPTNLIPRVIITPDIFEQIKREFANDRPMLVLVTVLYYTGMRLGEVLGLTWNDIDFEKNTVACHCQRKLNRGEHFEYIGELKTKQSNRIIYMNTALAEFLKEEKQRQTSLSPVTVMQNAMTERKTCFSFSSNVKPKIKYERLYPVCIKEDGAFINRGTAIRKLHAIGVNAHSFRHTQATLLAEAGIPPKALAARLGHSTVNLTLNLYTHNTALQQQRIAKTIDNLDKRFSSDNRDTINNNSDNTNNNSNTDTIDDIIEFFDT